MAFKSKGTIPTRGHFRIDESHFPVASPRRICNTELTRYRDIKTHPRMCKKKRNAVIFRGAACCSWGLKNIGQSIFSLDRTYRFLLLGLKNKMPCMFFRWIFSASCARAAIWQLKRVDFDHRRGDKQKGLAQRDGRGERGCIRECIVPSFSTVENKLPCWSRCIFFRSFSLSLSPL